MILLKNLCFRDILSSKNQYKLFLTQAHFRIVKFWKRWWIYPKWFSKILQKMITLVFKYSESLLTLSWAWTFYNITISTNFQILIFWRKLLFLNQLIWIINWNKNILMNSQKNYKKKVKKFVAIENNHIFWINKFKINFIFLLITQLNS